MANDLISILNEKLESGGLSFSEADLMSKVLAKYEEGKYRIVTLFEHSSLFPVVIPTNLSNVAPSDISVAVILDTETTGKSDADEIVELGLVKFQYNNKTGAIYDVLDVYCEQRQPSIPISPDASAISGIYDEDVEGKVIDLDKLHAFIEGTSLIIAHNAKFDRPMCEKLSDKFKEFSWACSFTEIDWAKYGVNGSSKLEYIAYIFGFYYKAHRADIDCFALLNALTLAETEDDNAMLDLIHAAESPVTVIWAVNAAFEAKDTLKAAGYRWSAGDVAGTEKSWFITVTDEMAASAQLEWLSESIYRNRPVSIRVDKKTAKDKFSDRFGDSSRVSLNSVIS